LVRDVNEANRLEAMAKATDGKGTNGNAKTTKSKTRSLNVIVKSMFRVS